MILFDALRAEEVLAGFREFYANSTLVNDFIPMRGEGSFIFGKRASRPDEQPNLYIDFCSGIGCSVLGHNPQAIQWGMMNLLTNGRCNLLPHNDWPNEQAVLLAKTLCEVTPGKFPKKVFFGNSGAEGVEAAVKTCQSRRYHAGQKNRKIFCAFGGAFHGRTLGALSLNCSKKKHTEAFFNDEGDLSTGTCVKNRAVQVRHLPFPEKGDEGVIADFNAILLDILHWHDTNAVFLELVQGEGGIRVVDPGSLQRLVQICLDEDVYLVVDEVQTGLMRTGKMFACNHYSLEPDIIILGKALGAGYAPISATVFKKEFDFKESGQHSNTFGGNPAACLMGRIVIDELQKLDKDLLAQRIKVLEEFAPEGLGLMRRIKFATHEEAERVVDKALDERLIVIEAGQSAVRLMPPVNTSPDILKCAIEKLKSVL